MSDSLLSRANLSAAMNHAFIRSRRNLLHWISWVIALGVLLTLTAVLHRGRIYQWEQSLTRDLQDVPVRQIIFDLTSPLTNVLSVQVLSLVAVTAVLAVALKRPDVAALLLITVPLHIAVQFPKAIFERPRPSSSFDGIEGVGGFNSFPSGHSEFSITFYGFVSYLIVHRVHHKRWRRAVTLLWVLFVLGTGFGRVALGRHWPLDVLGGYVGGLGLLSGLMWLHNSFEMTRRALPDAELPATTSHALAANRQSRG